MSVIGLDHVQVAAPQGCEAEARCFYGELLGLVEVEKPEGATRWNRPSHVPVKPGPIETELRP
jgi:hypothetical protein